MRETWMQWFALRAIWLVFLVAATVFLAFAEEVEEQP